MMLIMALLAAAAAPGDGKTMAMDDWSRMTVLGVGSDPANATTRYLRVAAGDLDGDGLPDEAILKLDCTGGVLRAAQYTVTGPRDMATGQASGKRMHKPVTFVKQWSAVTPQLSALRPTYDVKAMKGARAFAVNNWSPITLGNNDGLCPAASAAIVKSKSNITNN